MVLRLAVRLGGGVHGQLRPCRVNGLDGLTESFSLLQSGVHDLNDAFLRGDGQERFTTRSLGLCARVCQSVLEGVVSGGSAANNAPCEKAQAKGGAIKLASE